MADAVVVIPARWASTRFPGKVLAPLGGKPLVVWVCEVAARCRSVGEVVVATDDDRVLGAVAAAGFRGVLTQSGHRSGTDRVAEVAAQSSAGVVIGLQADEPFLAPADLDDLVAAAAEAPVEPTLFTLAAPLASRTDWLDPNIVKVVADSRGRALYFSRSPIPYPRPAAGPPQCPPQEGPPPQARQHIGVYAWRPLDLRRFTALAPSPLEQVEGLEQLRALEAGWTIRVLGARVEPLGVDTPDDLARAERRLLEHREPR